MPEFQGLCGRFTPTPCSIVWQSSTYVNQIGIYPAEFLPSKRTIWHATANGGYEFTPPIVAPGQTFGLGGIAGLASPQGGFAGFGPPQSDVFTPQSHFIVDFVRSENRLNATHTITQAEMDTLDSDGNIKIDVGEFIVEGIAVVDDPDIVIQEGELTEEERTKIAANGESEKDRIFRKLFTATIPGNRFENVVVNKLGIEYRLDNGGDKAIVALKSAGIGDLPNPIYRDSSSRIMLINAKEVTITGGTTGGPTVFTDLVPGRIIFLSYVAVKEHYIRQSVDISWTLQAASLPPRCEGFPSKIKAANYRFYNWLVEKTTLSPNLVEVRTGEFQQISGWRAVEAFNVPINFVAPVGTIINSSLADFILGNPFGPIATVEFMSGEVTLNGLISHSLPGFIPDTYDVTMNAEIGGTRYHTNEGAQNNNTAFRNAEWWTRGLLRFNAHQEEASRHLFFNVHPLALNKRDVDKFALDRVMAQEIEVDIVNGKDTFFPFMDEAKLDVPTNGANDFLDRSNTLFQPIEPVTGISVGNAEIECGVGGSVLLGLHNTPDDVIAALNYGSNIITERFEEDTKVIVERHFTVGQRGVRFVAIQGLLSARASLSCIGDPSRNYAFASHANGDGFLVTNLFLDREILSSMSELSFRPDLDAPPIKDNNSPTVNQFERRLGYNGILGDTPGFFPGQTVSLSTYSDSINIIFNTTSPERVRTKNPNNPDSVINTISVTQTANTITVPLSPGYHGRLELEYNTRPNSNNIEALLIFKSGGIESVVDSITILKASGNEVKNIDLRWVGGDTLEIQGDNLNELNIVSITVESLRESAANDFLEGQFTSTADDKLKVHGLNLIDRSLFFETDVMSIGEGEDSRLFVFFNDTDSGISCVESDDFSQSWFYHYGIVEQIDLNSSKHPFVVNAFEQNKCYLFFLFRGKIMCKTIDYSLFRFDDALLVERFEADRFEARTPDSPPREKIGLFSSDGRTIRRLTAHAAAGDLTDLDFMFLAGFDNITGDTPIFEPKEIRLIEDESGNFPPKLVRKNPIAIGSTTAFPRKDIESINFSAYVNDEGVLRLFFISPTSDGDELQCHFSIDNGTTWYDLWEYVEFDYNRLRKDSTKRTAFIDQNADGTPLVDIEGDDPLVGDQNAPFGINLHWSRLFRHKKGGKKDINAESNVLDFASPYAFFQPTTKLVFMFYVYEGCLLCKIFSDFIFEDAARSRGAAISGMQQVKAIIEKGKRAFFIDGDLTSADIREEVHTFVNTSINQRMSEGNIVFTHQVGMDVFDEDRTINPQRVCAYEIPNGNVRVLYKHAGSLSVKAAIYNGTIWMVEDLMRNAPNINDLAGPVPSPDIRDIVGGFTSG